LPVQQASFQSPEKIDQIYCAFVSQYLATGNILHAIGNEETTSLAKTISPVSLVSAIVKVSASDNVLPLSQLWILGHFLLIVEVSGRRSEYLRQSKFVQAIAQLLRHATKVAGFVAMRWSSIGIAADDDEVREEDEEEEEEDGDTDEEGDIFMKDDIPQRDISSFASFDSRIKSLIDGLVTRQQIAAIVTSATNDTAAEVANCLIAILQAFPTKRDTILMDLILIITTDDQAERKDIVGVLWARVKAGQLFQVAIGRKIELTQLHNVAYDADWPALVVLVYLYSRLLLTMIDDEFFDPSKSVINLDDVRVLSKFLSHIVFSMWWTDKKFDQTRSMGDTGVTFKQFRTIVTQCLIKIYLRDSRKPFLPEGHWLMMSETAAGFISAVQSEESEKEEEEMRPRRNRGIRAERRLYKRVVGKTSFATPRLNILRNVPFFIPFETRVEIFRGFIDRNRLVHSTNPFTFDHETTAQRPIQRANILEDAFETLGGMSRTEWKSAFHIKLMDQFGLEEVGIDGGGLTKEFLTEVCKEAFDPSNGLFMETPERLLYPSTNSEALNNLPIYEFIGKIVGKCLYENVLVDVEFAPFFLLRWFGRHAYLDDLPSLDKQIYNGLVFLKQFDGDFEDLALTFSNPVEEGQSHNDVDLIPNGRNIPVTYQNRLEYIQLVANYRLNLCMHKQASAFVRGLSDLIDVKWLVMFNQKELQTLVGGAEGKSIDVDELKRNTVLGGYRDQDPTVTMFWEVMKEMKEPEKRKFLKFVTSVERPPLLGFTELYPKFSIRKAGEDIKRVIFAFMNLLICSYLLPQLASIYSSFLIIRIKRC
jgi:ubiquitin-protein ligase E3 C